MTANRNSLTSSASAQTHTSLPPSISFESPGRATRLVHEARWIAGPGLLYALAVLAGAALLHPYFAQTWDVKTFIDAGRAIASSQWAALYSLSRAEQTWPYAYPPLHALLVAPFVALSGWIPDWLLVRVAPLLFDLGLGILLYRIVLEKTRAESWARLAFILWVINPVTWYDTAVQGHFEAEWLFCVVLAYWLAETRRGIILPSLALAVAFLIKQNAILFCIPYWMLLLSGGEPAPGGRRLWSVLLSGATFALPVVLVSLPFLLYSNDYWFMNVQYLAEAPLQTQSWLVALAQILGSNFFILRYSNLVLLVSGLLISVFAIRRGVSLWVTALLIVLAFFLLSKKVMGYYYTMLLPFALVELIPARRTGVLIGLVGASAWVSLSPYFASWTVQGHWWLYALLGAANSVGWLVLFVWLWRNSSREMTRRKAGSRPASAGDAAVRLDEGKVRALAWLGPALLNAAFAAALVQPLINNPISPIRAPLVPETLQFNAVFALAIFAALCLAGWLVLVRVSRPVAPARALPRWVYAFGIFVAPLYFLTFALTKESTAVVEMVLKMVGL